MTQTTKNLMIKEAAKILQIGSTTLFKLLKQRKVIGTTNNLPRQEHIKDGIFVVDIRQTKIGQFEIKKNYPVTLVTPKGLCFLREIIEQENAEH